MLSGMGTSVSNMQCAFVATIYCTIIVMDNCIGINLIDVTNINDYDDESSTLSDFYHRGDTKDTDTPDADTLTTDQKRRFMIVTPKPVFRQGDADEEKDNSLKSKIKMLVEQCIHDARDKMETVESLKDKYKEDSSYKVGFIFHNLKRSKDVMSELFNVAVKHRHDWKALEQMKIFELIVHTNVDTTNLVRQLVELHLQNLNSTQSPNTYKKRVVLL